VAFKTGVYIYWSNKKLKNKTKQNKKNKTKNKTTKRREKNEKTTKSEFLYKILRVALN